MVNALSCKHARIRCCSGNFRGPASAGRRADPFGGAAPPLLDSPGCRTRATSVTEDQTAVVAKPLLVLQRPSRLLWCVPHRGVYFLTRTLDRVSTEMSLHVLAYNLKRVMKLLGTAVLMEAMQA